MRKGRAGEKKWKKNKNNDENSGPLTSLPVDRLTGTNCNADRSCQKLDWFHLYLELPQRWKGVCYCLYYWKAVLACVIITKSKYVCWSNVCDTLLEARFLKVCRYNQLRRNSCYDELGRNSMGLIVTTKLVITFIICYDELRCNKLADTV